MADKKYLNKLSLLLLLKFSLVLLVLTSSTTMADEEEGGEELSIRDLNAAIYTLRSNGYNLFANSIALSDLSFQILTVTSTSHGGDSGGGEGGGGGGRVGGCGYTLLAPPNSALFSLGMSTDAFTYVHSLRFHVIPRRLSYAELRSISLSSDPSVETLAGHVIAVAASAGRVIAIDGVLVTFPDMHLRPKIAVHGLDGILVSSAARVGDLGFVTAAQPFAGAFAPKFEEIAPSPEIATATPSPAASFAPFTIVGSFDSVSLPPEDRTFSPENVETPTFSPSSPSSTPSPSPACSNWNDCESEYLSPYYVWSPSPSQSLSPSLMSAYEEGGEGEFTEIEDAVKRDYDALIRPLLPNQLNW